MSDTKLAEEIAKEFFDVWKEAKSSMEDNWDDAFWDNLPQKHKDEYLKTAKRILALTNLSKAKAVEEVEIIFGKQLEEAKREAYDDGLDDATNDAYNAGLKDKEKAVEDARKEGKKEVYYDIHTDLMSVTCKDNYDSMNKRVTQMLQKVQSKMQALK